MVEARDLHTICVNLSEPRLKTEKCHTTTLMPPNPWNPHNYPCKNYPAFGDCSDPVSDREGTQKKGAFATGSPGLNADLNAKPKCHTAKYEGQTFPANPNKHPPKIDPLVESTLDLGSGQKVPSQLG